MSKQTSSAWVDITANGATGVASLPYPANKTTASAGGSLADLADEREHLSDQLEISLEAIGGAVSLANVRVHLFEDAEWMVLGQTGAGDVAFTTLDLVADWPCRFTIGNPGRATRVVITADAYTGMIRVRAKRIDNL
jgi:hypothetical protein